MTDAEWVRQADDLALARNSVICPLVCRQLSFLDKIRTKAEILGAQHVFPGGIRKVSRRVLERWCDWYTEGHSNEEGEIVTVPGIEALRPLPRQDKGLPRVVDEKLIERAIFFRREEPARNTRALLELLAVEATREGRTPPDIKEATLAYHLRQHKATKKDLRREGRTFRRYEQPRRNSTWQGDWTQGFSLNDPSSPKKAKLCHLHAFLDDHSRYIVHAEFYFRQNLPCLEDCFRKAILKGGIPERVYWDNAAVYHSRQIQMVAARLQTQLIFSTPYSPEGKGKIERWFRTVKDSFYPEARAAGLESLADLNQFFWAWLERNYHSRVHSEIESTPKNRWEMAPEQIRHPAPASMVDLFWWEEKRRVDKSGCVHIGGNAYPAAEHLVGQEVELRFDPFDLAHVRLYENGSFSQLLEPQTLVSKTFRKAIPVRKSTPSSRESSLNYRAQLTDEFRQATKDTIGKARGDRPLLSQSDFFDVLQENLRDRQLSPVETQLAQDFYARNAPLAKASVETALLRAFEAKGSHRHIRFYLEFIQAVRLDERGSL